MDLRGKIQFVSHKDFSHYMLGSVALGSGDIKQVGVEVTHLRVSRKRKKVLKQCSIIKASKDVSSCQALLFSCS